MNINVDTDASAEMFGDVPQDIWPHHIFATTVIFVNCTGGCSG
jgi:hypothetical protein